MGKDSSNGATPEAAGLYWAYIRDGYAVLGKRLPLLFAGMSVASALEGISLTALMPLLARLDIGDAGRDNAIMQAATHALDTLGVPYEVGPLMAFIVGVLFLQVAATFAAAWHQTHCTTLYTAFWRRRLFDSVINADWPYLRQSHADVQANQIVNEASRVNAALNSLLFMANGLFFILVYAAIALLAAWQVVVLLFVFGLGVYLATRPLARRGRQVGEMVTEVSRSLMHRTQEFLANAKLIKATATEDIAIRLFRGANEDYRRVYRTTGTLLALIQFVYMTSGYIVLGFGVWYGTTRLEVDPVAVIVAVYIFLRLYVQLANVQRLRQAFLQAAPALGPIRREFAASSARAEHGDGGGGDPHSPGGVEIVFDRLRVSYEGAPALKDIDIKIDSGMCLGLTGGSGAGKSTLVDAVAGLIAPDGGEVRIDGTPLARLDLRAWRRHIGYVAQDTLLMNGPISENIAWGQPGASRAEIESAARLANAHEFIAAMPEGYDSSIGGRGVRLSGGQRQRIGLARAMLGNKRLVILDEATSALDSESEFKVMRAVAELKGRVTLIVVAHRLSTLRDADAIAVLEKGELAELGSFDALVKQSGPFSRLWALQSHAPSGPAPIDAKSV